MSKLLDFYDWVYNCEWFTHKGVCERFSVSYRTSSRWIAMVDARINLIREILDDNTVRMRKNGN